MGTLANSENPDKMSHDVPFAPRQVFSEIFFSKCGHFWGIRCH